MLNLSDIAALPGSNDGVKASIFKRKMYDFAFKGYPKYISFLSKAMERVY